MTGPERWRLAVATGFGLGRAPIAPGTVGSLAGLALVFVSWKSGGPWAVVAVAGLVAALGWWSAAGAEARFGRRDPGPVVIDEIAGQMVSLAFLAPTLPALAVGFLLFRVFDIWKPFPVRRAERLRGASGIMTDDLLAGVYANLVQHTLQWAFPSWWGVG